MRRARRRRRSRVRPSRPSRRSLPCAQVIRASAPPLSAAAERAAAPPQLAPCRRSSRRASISSVTPGQRARSGRPPRWRPGGRRCGRATGSSARGRRRAATSPRRPASAARRACESRSDITASVASAPSPCASIRISAPISSVTGLQIDQHLLARFHPHALANNRPHRPVQLLRHRNKAKPYRPNTTIAPKRMVRSDAGGGTRTPDTRIMIPLL